jgi:hypothetical protein
MKTRWLLKLAMLGALAGCAMTSPEAGISPPEESGLIGVRGYPEPGSPCQVIGENALTNAYLDDSALLIGCPAGDEAEVGARVAEGARILTREGAWLLLSLPNTGRQP